MSDIVAQVLGVAGETTRNGKTLYRVSLSDGEKYTTFDAALAQQAQALTGQTVSASVTVQQKGQYTNRYLERLSAPAPLAAAPAPTPIPMVSTTSGGGGMSPEREERIVKESCFSTAFGFYGSLYGGTGQDDSIFEAALEQKALNLAKLLYAKVFNLSVETATTPQGIAAAVPGVQVGAPAPDTLVTW